MVVAAFHVFAAAAVAAVCLSCFSSLECDGDGIGIRAVLAWWRYWAEPAWWRSALRRRLFTKGSSSAASCIASACKTCNLLLSSP